MIGCRGMITLTVAMVITILLHTGCSEAKSLSDSRDDVFESVLSKRNSWWSKKSLDSIGDLAENSFNSQESKCESTQALFGCYVDSCVPQFVACARRSMSEVGFESCKIKHRICSVRCMTDVSMEDLTR